MPKLKLTRRSIEAHGVPLQGRLELWDTQVPGLLLRVTPGGARTWGVKKKVRGQSHYLTLGELPTMTIEQAREAAIVELAEIATGKRRRTPTLRSSLTLDQFFEKWLPEYAAVHRPGTAAHDEKLYRRHIGPTLGRRGMLEIDTTAIRELHAAVGAAISPRTRKPIHRTANSMVRLLSAIYRVAVEWGYAPANPAQGLRLYSENRRDRFLAPEEMHRLLTALHDVRTPPDLRDLVLLALLTGVRRGNLFTARWEHIDLVSAVWAIPAEEMKARRPLRLPLPPAAVQILTQRRAFRSAGESYVFPGPGMDGHIVNASKPWKELRQRADITGFTWHDLRHTNASYQAATGASLTQIGAALGHRSPTTTARYSHLDLSSVRRSLEAGATAMLNAGFAADEPGVETG